MVELIVASFVVASVVLLYFDCRSMWHLWHPLLLCLVFTFMAEKTHTHTHTNKVGNSIYDLKFICCSL